MHQQHRFRGQPLYFLLVGIILMALISASVFDAAAHPNSSPAFFTGGSVMPPGKDPTDTAIPSASPLPTSTATPSQTITPSATSSPTPTPLTGLTFVGSSYGCTSGPYVTCSATVTNTHTDPQRWDFDITFTYNDASTIFGSNFSLTLAFTTGVFNTNVPIWWEMYPTANEVMPNRWIDVQYPTVPDLNPMPYPSGSWTVGGQPSPYQTFWINFSRDTGDTETLVRTDSWHVTIATYDFQSLTPTPTPILNSTPTILPTATLPSSGYDRVAAVNYADQWAHEPRNPNYPNYGVEADGDNCKDCTNYLSQVLEAGGIPQIPGINNIYHWYTYQDSNGVWWGSGSWAATDLLNWHVSQFQGVRYEYYPEGPANLSAGDFFLMSLVTDPFIQKPDHARVIVGMGTVLEGDYTGEWMLLANQHCHDRQRVWWGYNIPDGTLVWAWHVVY